MKVKQMKNQELKGEKQMIQDKMSESKCNNEKIKRLKEQGVTLVALVVTIIIMLILAGVALSIALGDNGLISMAKKATEKYQDAQQGEEDSLQDLEDNLKATLKEAGEKADVPHNANWDTNKVTPTSDGKGNVIPVPKGFYYAGGDKNTGFVISDTENDDLDNSKHGNQFVWIPCTADEYEKAKDDVMDYDWSHNSQYETNGASTEGNGLAWSDDYSETDNTFINNTYKDASDTPTLPTSSWENNQTTVAKQVLVNTVDFI